MKVYAVIVNFCNGREAVIHGLYKQYKHARQAKEALEEYNKDLFNAETRIKIVRKEIVE